MFSACAKINHLRLASDILTVRTKAVLVTQTVCSKNEVRQGKVNKNDIGPASISAEFQAYRAVNVDSSALKRHEEIGLSIFFTVSDQTNICGMQIYSHM